MTAMYAGMDARLVLPSLTKEKKQKEKKRKKKTNRRRDLLKELQKPSPTVHKVGKSEPRTWADLGPVTRAV